MSEMDNRPVGILEFVGRAKVEDERFARDKERLDKQESAVDRVSELTVQMGEMIKSS